jgi:hypothetical protein
LDLHELVSGTDVGRRSAALQVLNRSGIVLVCAVWEAYCEDLVAEALNHLVNHVSGPGGLPDGLRKLIAKEVRADPHDLAAWALAGDGWKSYVVTRLGKLELERNRGLNTPKAKNIDSLFADGLGMSSLSDAWHWSGMGAPQATRKLDDYVSLRGDIAHRGSATSAVGKNRVRNFLSHATSLVGMTDAAVNDFVASECGTPLY